jgi:two-component system, OmpR family, sensor kinase
LALLGFWYYKASENALSNTTFYKMQHYADMIGGRIISAEMHGKKLVLPTLEAGYAYLLVPLSEHKQYRRTYFDQNGYKVLISPSPQDHMGIQYVIVKTTEYHAKILHLQKEVAFATAVLFLLVTLISSVLAKLFMRPIRQKVDQIERFIQDISHELNTPITALQMSAQRALQKKEYDAKSLTHILISTKQLLSIYRSLTYLSFTPKEQEIRTIDLKTVVEETVEFYAQLCEAKRIRVQTDLQPASRSISLDKAHLLFSNLLSNAVKYSLPNSTIYITLSNQNFTIRDEGVGIEKSRLEKIFEPYERGSHIAGGFGVGLSIVKQICDEEKIGLFVTSKLHQGSTFTLVF